MMMMSSGAKGTVAMMTSKSSIGGGGSGGGGGGSSGGGGGGTSVHPKLLDGCKFVKWDDDTGVGIPVTLKVDRNSFFLYWIDQNGDTEFLEISSIRDTRTGKYARTPRSEGKLKESINIGPQEQTLEEKTLTVVYGPDFVNVSFINFCTDSRDTAQLWTNEILKMAYNLMAINASVYRFLEKAHTRLLLMTDRDGRLPVKNVVKMFASHKDDKKRIEKALEACDLPSGKADTIHPEKINLQKFLDFYKHLIVRSEVMEIFEKMCNSCSNASKKKVMTVDQFVDFLNKEQRDPRLNEILYPYANRSRAHDLIEQYEPSRELAAKGHFSFDGFLRYLMSADNAIVPSDKFELNSDMDQPLSHYFINSSHNTYLTGHQLTGKSSVEIYRQCLLAGCRCIELDCWNGRSDDEPIITHGYTVVTDVPLKEVLEAICESSFKTSEYPVILSFENHCSSKQQAKMAAYCRKIFGEMLLTEPLPGHPLRPGVPLPSPNQFLRKIIIKNKKKHYKRNRKTKNIPASSSAASSTAAAPTTAINISAPLNNPGLTSDTDTSSSLGTASIITTSTTAASSAPQHVPVTASASSLSTSPSANVSPSTYETRPELVTSNSDDSGPSGSSQVGGGGGGGFNEADDLLLLSSQAVDSNTATPVSDHHHQHHHHPQTHHQQPAAAAAPSSSSSTGGGQHATASSSSNIIKNSSCDIDDADSDSSLEDEDVIEEHSIADLSGSAASSANAAAVAGAAGAAAGGGSKEPEAGSEMSELVIYVQPIRFHAFELAEKRDRSFEVSSFDETQSTSLLKERPIDFVNYNKRQMSRIYPKGTRVNSSNYMPQIFWNAGCQMVALNFQTLDLGMQLNLGIFEYNGRNGYLLKPDFMRRQDRRFDPFTESTVDGIIAGTVSIKIISGQFLCDKRVGTYVEVDMYGLPADTVRRKRTRIVPGNGLNPIYDEEPFVFKKVVLPDLACLRIAVFEENGKFIGTRILPVVGLRPGYRHISLRNESLQPLTLATLFVHITVKDYVPDGLSELADALANPIAYQSMVEKHAKQLLALTDEADEAALASQQQQDGERGERGGGHHPASATSKISSGSGSGSGGQSTADHHHHPGQQYSRSSHDQEDSLRQYIRDVHSLNEGGGGGGNHHPYLSKSETARSETVNGSGYSGGGGGGGTSSSKVGSPNHKSFSGGTAGSGGGGSGGGMRRQDTLNRKVTTSMKVFDDYVLDKIPSLLESSEAILSAEPLEKLRQAKAVQKIYAKLERDVAGLAKKYDKSREKCRESYLAEEEKAAQALEKQKKLATGASSKSMKKNADGSKRTSVVDIQVFEDEYNSKVRDLQKSYSDAVLNLLIEQHKEEFKLFEFKYHEQLSAAFDKVTEESQSAQIGTLKTLHDKEVAVLMKRLENQNKEELVAVAKKFKDKNELARIKRELQQRLIDQAVNERQRFKTLHAKLETDLRLKHDEVRRSVEEEKRAMVARRRKAFEEKVEQMRQTYKMDVGLFLQTYLPTKSA